jgi:hypothetical protein
MSGSQEHLPQDEECLPIVQIDSEGFGVQSIPNLDLPPNPELVAQGWERRFMADPDRAEETTRLYEELGFEVRKEPVKTSELSDICSDCGLVACKTYVTIYTRKQKE